MQGIFSLLWLLMGWQPLLAQLPLRVEDITDSLGMSTVWLPPSGEFRPWEAFHGRALPFDFDRDGDLDLLLTGGPRRADSLSLGSNRFYRQDDSGWVDITVASGLDSLPPAGMGAVGDIDGDGFLDLYLCMLGRDYLLRNDSGRTFSDITDSAGVYNPYWSTAAVFLDADYDGDLDIYVVNFIQVDSLDTLECYAADRPQRTFCSPELYPAAPNRLFINNGAGRFLDATAGMGATDTTSRSLAVSLLDADADGDLDLFVLSYRSPNLLYLTGPGSSWREAGLVSGLAFSPEGTEPVWAQAIPLDVDQNGAVDVLFLQPDGRMRLLLNDGSGHFFPGHYQGGLFHPLKTFYATGGTVVDLDFNGTLDLLLTDQVAAARNAAGGNEGHFSRLLLATAGGRFKALEMAYDFRLDTTLLAPRKLRRDAQSSARLFGDSLWALPGPQIAGYAAFDSGLVESSPLEEYFPAAARYNRLSAFDDSVAIEEQGDDTITVHQEPDKFVIADLTGDGIPEIVASYPVGLIRVWRLVPDEFPTYLGLFPRSDQPGATVVGAQITVTFGGRLMRRPVVDHNPLLFYFPAGTRNVNVAVRWPDGLVNHYAAARLNGYFTLDRQDPEQ